jgi:chromosome segregation ATPase
METTPVNTISVDRVIALQQSLDAKVTEIASLNREIGAQEAHLVTLEAQIEELKSKQPEVRIIKGANKETWHGIVSSEEVVEYRNLDSVKMDIEKVMDKKYKANIEKLEIDLKIANFQLETRADELSRAKLRFESDKENQRTECKIYKYSLIREYEEKEVDKDNTIKKLEEELVKVKEDKTDEQLEKLRTEEIATLKLQIKKLKNQVDEFLGMNIFKRTWLALTNKAVRVAAEKEIQEKERELEVNRYEQQRLNNSRKSGKGLIEQIMHHTPNYFNW